MIAGTRVLCVGDAMLDLFIYGSVERISPEGPILILTVEREETMLGGGERGLQPGGHWRCLLRQFGGW